MIERPSHQHKISYPARIDGNGAHHCPSWLSHRVAPPGTHPASSQGDGDCCHKPGNNCTSIRPSLYRQYAPRWVAGPRSKRLAVVRFTKKVQNTTFLRRCMIWSHLCQKILTNACIRPREERVRSANGRTCSCGWITVEASPEDCCVHDVVWQWSTCRKIPA
jgi:hypothetical protein